MLKWEKYLSIQKQKADVNPRNNCEEWREESRRRHADEPTSYNVGDMGKKMMGVLAICDGGRPKAVM